MPQELILTPVDGSATIPVRVATSWEDVSLEAFLRLHTADETTMLAALTGLEGATIDALAADDVTYLATALSFVSDAVSLLEMPPSKGLPEVGASSYGLLQLATQHVQSLPEGSAGILAGPYLYALYTCQQTYGKVDDAKIEALRLQVLAQPVTKVYADVAFFLRSYKRATTATPPTPKTKSSPKKRNWKQALKSLVSGSGPSSHSTPQPRASA